MKSRIILSIILIAMIPGLSFLLHQAFVPEQATELALQQMNEDGSRETLRAIEQLSNWIDIGLIFGGIFGLLILWVDKISVRRHLR